ncbi:MAG: MFS transporter [Spirochaetaceae bacterium]|nr:MAG: MFS transporter [Spirochaetaceae bacterium]
MARKSRDRLAFLPLDYASGAAFLVYASSAVVTPICLLILAHELSFSLSGGGGVEGMRSALILVSLLGSGIVAARWGKAMSLGAGSIALGLGLFAYAIAPAYGVVLLAVAFVGVGGGVIEGLLNPLVQDLHPDDSGRYLNILNAFFSIGVLATVLLSGELLTQGVSWRIIMATVASFSIAVGLGFVVMDRRSPFVRSVGAADVLGHKISVLRHPRFWIFLPMMFLGGGAEGALTFWSASYIQLNFGALPRMGGIGTAFFAGGMIVGRLGSGWLVPQKHLWHLILFSAISGFFFSLALPLIGGLWMFFAVLFLAGLSIACFWPSIQSYSVDRMPLDSTVVFILLSCGGIPGFGAVSWIMGIIGDRAGLNASLYVIPVLLALLAILAVIERRWKPENAVSAIETRESGGISGTQTG